MNCEFERNNNDNNRKKILRILTNDKKNYIHTLFDRQY